MADLDLDALEQDARDDVEERERLGDERGFSADVLALLSRLRAAEQRVRELEALVSKLWELSECPRDHACGRCKPGGNLVDPTFTCAFHRGLDVRTALDAAKDAPEVVDGECQQDCDALGVPCPKRAAKEGT